MYQYVVHYDSVAIYDKNTIPARIWPDMIVTTERLRYINVYKIVTPTIELSVILVAGLLL